MKKYIVYKNEFPDITKFVVCVEDNEVFTSFPAEKENPNYDSFLIEAQLTDEQVHELEPDVWYYISEINK